MPTEPWVWCSAGHLASSVTFFADGTFCDDHQTDEHRAEVDAAAVAYLEGASCNTCGARIVKCPPGMQLGGGHARAHLSDGFYSCPAGMGKAWTPSDGREDIAK
jgi:hypothetical protein